MEVPSWAWQRKLQEVESYLASQVNAIDPFVWPFLRDNLAVCHCLFSRRSVTITPIFPPVDMLPTFENCPRRIYMSATIADDSEIVRAFGASPDAVGKPITSTSLAGVGERMAQSCHSSCSSQLTVAFPVKPHDGRPRTRAYWCRNSPFHALGADSTKSAAVSPSPWP